MEGLPKKADIMNFEDEKSYDYTSDWSGTFLKVFDHYIRYLRGRGSVIDPWFNDMTPSRLAELDKKKEPYTGPVMFAVFLKGFLKNPFHSPFRRQGDRYAFPTKNGWRQVNHQDFFERVRDYLWYHFRMWSAELLLVIGELEVGGKRLTNLYPVLAKRINTVNPGATYICEQDQVRFVTKWLAPRIESISLVPCINFAGLRTLLERCAALGMITF